MTSSHSDVYKRQGYGSGMILGQNPGAGSIITNVYYDNRYSQADGGSSYSSNWGTGLSTEAMLGDKLKSGLGNTNWTFREGNYPMLNWMKDLGSAKLFSTTLGALKPLDNACLLYTSRCV